MIIIILSFYHIAFSNIILVCVILGQFEEITEFFIVLTSLLVLPPQIVHTSYPFSYLSVANGL